MKNQSSENIEERRLSSDKDNTSSENSQVVSKKRRRSYTLAFLLYPDNPDHGRIFAEVIKRFDYAYILHDKDEKEMDFKEHCLDPDNPSDLDLLKKTHYHVLTFHPSQKSSLQLAKELQLEPRFVREVTDRNAMLLYLTHIGDRSKHQYSLDEVVSNRRSIYLEGLQTMLTNSERLDKMISIIQNKKCVTVGFALRVLSAEGLTDFALKHFSVLKTLVEENYIETRFTPFGELSRMKTLPLETVSDQFNLDEMMKK